MEEDERRRDRCVRRGLFGPMKLDTNPLLFPMFHISNPLPYLAQPFGSFDRVT